MRRRAVLVCLAATAIAIGLPARGHETEDAAHGRADAGAAAPAFGTAIDFHEIDLACFAVYADTGRKLMVQIAQEPLVVLPSTP